MSTLPDLEAWAIFARVADLGSFSRAATELQLSKATVSKALTRLEARLGAPLFHRSSRRLSLTESGLASLERARRILAEGEAAEEAAAAQTAELRGMVRVAAPVSFGMQNIGPLLPGFLARYPAVAIDLRLSDRVVDLIAEGIDLAVRIGVLASSSLRARALFPVHVPLVASHDYLARRGTPSHPSELSQHDAFVYSHLANPEVWQFRHAAEGAVSVRVNPRLRFDNADVALPALRAGLGIAQIPDFVACHALAEGSLAEVLPEWTAPSGAVHLVTPPGAVRPTRVTALIEYLARELRPVTRLEVRPSSDGGKPPRAGLSKTEVNT